MGQGTVALPPLLLAWGGWCSVHGYQHGHSTGEEGPDLALVPQGSHGTARGLGLTCPFLYPLHLRDHIKPWGPQAWGT